MRPSKIFVITVFTITIAYGSWVTFDFYEVFSTAKEHSAKVVVIVNVILILLYLLVDKKLDDEQ